LAGRQRWPAIPLAGLCRGTEPLMIVGRCADMRLHYSRALGFTHWGGSLAQSAPAYTAVLKMLCRRSRHADERCPMRQAWHVRRLVEADEQSLSRRSFDLSELVDHGLDECVVARFFAQILRARSPRLGTSLGSRGWPETCCGTLPYPRCGRSGARFLVETTIGFVKFSVARPKTVGGSIAIAAITKHEGFQWVQRQKGFGTSRI
jgi:hypothetical protein